MTATTVVVVAFEVWPWPALGCYGHDWIATPGWDALAAEGFVFDRAVAWPVEAARAVALERCRAAGVRTILLTEAGLPPWSGPWDDHRTVTGDERPDAPWAEQSATRLFAAAIESLRQSTDGPRLIVVQARGWVPGIAPPRAALELYAEDFAADGIDIAAIPDADLAESTAGRATRISLLDHGVSLLAEALVEQTAPTWCTLIAQQGAVWRRLTRAVELPDVIDPQRLLVPFVVWSNVESRRLQPGRTAAVVSTADLWPSVITWLGSPADSLNDARDLTPLIAGHVRSVHDVLTQSVPGWDIRWTLDEITVIPQDSATSSPAAGRPRRYHLPEDPWAICDVTEPVNS
jgi:hypothetical protein